MYNFEEKIEWSLVFQSLCLLDSVLSRGESTTALSTPVVPSLDAILEQQHQSLFHSAGIYQRGRENTKQKQNKNSRQCTPL